MFATTSFPGRFPGLARKGKGPGSKVVFASIESVVFFSF